MFFTLMLYSFFSVVNCAVVINSETKFQPIYPTAPETLLKEDKTYWFKLGSEILEKNINYDKEQKIPVAKNVIIFIGDGMGISTITATRIYKGQRIGKSGEEHSLVYDNFPNAALVKTYNVDMQVPDSAGTATALFTGVKANYEAIGVDVKSNKTVFDKNVLEDSKLETIMTWAQRSNKYTGIITTTRITHATPAATYSHVNRRQWECDSKIPENIRNDFKDIARQLMEDAPGNNFKVILGGGYQQLGHITQNQSEECMRSDGLNLTRTWLDNHKQDKAAFVTNNEELSKISDDTDYLLGVFDADNLPYELIRNKGPEGTPSLLEMTQKGLQILEKSSNGYVLMVEGGRIDHGHHDNYARIALEESSQFEETISWVVGKTGSDTLIIVTADHSHTMTLNGYAERGNDILGFGILGDSKKPALTLTYANGRGFNYHYTPNETSVLGPWKDAREDINRLIDPKYRHMATFDQKDESHGGEDVAIFAKGPSSHLVRGVIEQNYVAHLVSYAACIGPHAGRNPFCEEEKSITFSSANFCCVHVLIFAIIAIWNFV